MSESPEGINLSDIQCLLQSGNLPAILGMLLYYIWESLYLAIQKWIFLCIVGTKAPLHIRINPEVFALNTVLKLTLSIISLKDFQPKLLKDFLHVVSAAT